MRDNPPRPLPWAGTRTPFAFSTKVSDLAPLIISVKIAERIGDQAWPRDCGVGPPAAGRLWLYPHFELLNVVQPPVELRPVSRGPVNEITTLPVSELSLRITASPDPLLVLRPDTSMVVVHWPADAMFVSTCCLSISNRLALRDQLDREVAIARCDDSCRDRRAGHALCLGQRTLHRFRSSSPCRSSPADSASSSARSRLQSQAASIAA